MARFDPCAAVARGVAVVTSILTAKIPAQAQTTRQQRVIVRADATLDTLILSVYGHYFVWANDGSPPRLGYGCNRVQGATALLAFTAMAAL